MGNYVEKTIPVRACVNAKDTSNKRILVLGLDGAGKTSVLHRILTKPEEEPDFKTTPTIGFNVEQILLGATKKINYTLWDVGGQDKIRNLWRHYFSGVSGLIFVIDSSDTERISEAGEELLKVVNNPEMKSVPFIILANKQDEKKALKIEEIKKKIELDKISNFRRKWDILPCSAVNGEGVIEGLESLNLKVRLAKEEKMKTAATLNRNNIRKSFRIKPRK